MNGPVAKKIGVSQGTALVALKRKPKMRFSLKAKLRSWFFANHNMDAVPDDRVIQSVPNLNYESSINFQVMPAAGGQVVQVQTYDKLKDRHMTSLHIITPDEDLGESLAQILKLTQLSR